MVEAPIPAERSLVPRVLVTERPYLTHDQTQTVGKLTIDYLRRNKVVFTQDSIKAAFEVLAFDALPRGLALEGKQRLGEGDNVRKLIAKGLENRKGVRERAQAALRLEGNQNLLGPQGDFVGTYAFDRELSTRVSRGISGFVLIADIKDYDEIAYQYEFRKAALPVLAEAAINTLPKERFHQASLDRIPDSVDQAKLVRNSLVSLAFKGEPYPVLSIEQLRLILLNPALGDKSRGGAIEKFIKLLPDSELARSKALADYILALLSQTEFFLMHPRLVTLKSESDLINIRDSIFTELSPVLLLLHPALEEERLITDPKDAGRDSYSLWSPQLSIIMDGLRFPTQQGLTRAIRFYRAQGFEVSRYAEGREAWSSYFKAKEQEQKRVPNLEESIERIEQEIKSLLSGEELSPYAYDLMRTYHRDIHDQVMFIRSKLLRYNEAIKEAEESPQEAEAYYQKVLEENHGNIPDRMRVPDSIAKQRKSGLKHSYTAKREVATRILEENFLAEDELRSRGLNSWDKLTDEELSKEIASLRFSIDQIRAGGSIPRDFPSGEELSKFIENQVRLLEKRIAGRGRGGVRALPGDKERLADINPIYSQVINWRSASASEKKRRIGVIRRSFYLYELSNRLGALRTLQGARERKKDLTENSESELYYWTREEMLRWKQIIIASNFPANVHELSDLERFSEEARKWEDQYFTLDPAHKGNLLPRIMSSTDALTNHLRSRLELFREYEQAQPPRDEDSFNKFMRKKENLKQQIVCLATLIDLFNNPLFPFSESVGLGSRDFLAAVFSRMRLARVLLSIRKEDRPALQLEKRYGSMVRDTYLEHLRIRKKKVQEELDEISTNPASKARLIQKMKELDLVIPEPQTQA